MSGADLPRWVTLLLLPALNLLAALLVGGLLVAAIGEDPWRAMALLVDGAVGFPEAIGFTLHYTTNFVFAGLAVAVAFHGGLFNIGAEGQAYIAGLGAALVCLALPGWHWSLVLPLALIAAMGSGAAWAAIPGWLQAYRGSHVVVTTIMFNFIASALMTWVLVDWLRAPGQQAPESAQFHASTWLPFLHDMLAPLGLPRSPLNLAALIALTACGLVWVFLWRSRTGYELRTVGANPHAAAYAGMPVRGSLFAVMLLSGGLAGLVAINEVMGVQHRLLLNFPGGAGFVGIAVALMGRNHPVGILAASLLFGALYQGGAELSFEMQSITRDMVVAIQGLIILFCGALENLFRAPLERLFRPGH